MAAGDFDGDGDLDIVGGSVGTAAFLVYYENDGTGHFTRNEIAIPDATCVGTVGIMTDDFTGDGRADIFVATDRAYRGGTTEARIWFLRNRGVVDGQVDWLFRCLNGCTAPTPDPYDIDMATPLDYDDDGDMDLVIADANHSGDYYYIENELASVYELYGRAQSTNIGAGLLDPRLHAVTRIRVSSIRQGVLGGSSAGLAVELLFSNNAGRSWETYQTFSGAGIVNATNLPWYDFKNFGADLRWRIVLTAEEDAMVDYQNASFETPLRRRPRDRVHLRRPAGVLARLRGGDHRHRRAGSTRSSSSARRSSSRAGRASSGPTTSRPSRSPPSATSELRTITTSDLDAATGRTLIDRRRGLLGRRADAQRPQPRHPDDLHGHPGERQRHRTP